MSKAVKQTETRMQRSIDEETVKNDQFKLDIAKLTKELEMTRETAEASKQRLAEAA